ncbi:hypothetical protein Pfo_029465, partial [Paulownia fortunei]
THYHLGLRNHENFSYANNRNVLQPPPDYNNPPNPNLHIGEKKASLEDLLGTFISERRTRLNKDEGLEMKTSKVNEPMISTLSESPMEEQLNEEKRQSNEQIEAEKLKSNPNFDTSPKFDIPIHFPQRFQKKKIDSQFANFLKIFKKIHINISFVDNLEQMLNYARFMKDVMLRKR